MTVLGQLQNTRGVTVNAGTLTLAAANTYGTGTTIAGGVLAIGDSDALSTGNVAFTGNGTLRTDAAVSVANAFSLATGATGTIDIPASIMSTLSGPITGTGGLAKTGAGRLILTGTDTYTGGTTIAAGILQVGNGSGTGSISGNVVNSGGLWFNRSNALTYGGVVSGTGSVVKLGSASTLTFTGDNTYTGLTTIGAGTLQLGDGGTTGSIAGNIVDNGTLVFNRSNALTYGGIVSGTGTLAKAGGGVLRLTGANTYAGTTAVNAGTLLVNGSLATSALAAASGATFGGRGLVAGAVTISDGAHLSPGDGNTTGALGVGSLTLASGSFLDYHFGTPNDFNPAVNDVVNVTGNLTLAGTLNIYNVGGFGQGVYRLFNYDGTLTDNGLAFGQFPSGFAAGDFAVQTADPGKVNLVVASGGLVNQFWDGPPTAANGTIDGGTGTWTLAASNWTNLDGNINAQWAQFGFAIFTGAAGTVTLGDTVRAGGLQFVTDGYELTAGSTAHTIQADPDFIVRVDPGTTATLAAPLVDAGGGAATLTKTDAGTLVLAGANTYSGGTQVNGGTIQISSDANLGAAAGALGLDSGTLRTTANLTTARSVTLGAGGGSFRTDAGTTLTLTTAVDGDGMLTKLDTGTLALTADNTYLGGTTVSAGTLQLGNGGATGGVVGDIHVDAAATLAFFRSDPELVLTNSISGSGTIRFQGTGVLDQSSYKANAVSTAFTGLAIVESGARLILEGASQVDSRGARVESGGSLYLTGAVTYQNPIALAGEGWLENSGRLGALRLGDLTTVNGAVTLSADARIGVVNATGTISGVIDDGNLGNKLEKVGSGTLVLSGNNTYTGTTKISDGTLQVGAGGTTGSVTGNITDETALVFNRSDVLAYAGNISGSGTLTQNGTGTLILTGTNAPAGGTTIAIGTLQLGAGGMAGSLTGNITDNGSLVVNRSDALTLAGTITGTGSLTQAGTGTLVLTGDNSFAGTTLISHGTLQLGAGTITGGVTGPIMDNAALVFNRSDTLTYANVISGTGSLEQLGAGTLVLAGANTHAGGTILTGGTLQVAADENLGAAGGALVFNGDGTGGTLRFGAAFNPDPLRPVTLVGGRVGIVDTNSFDVAFGAVIAGGGGLDKTGAGTLTLTNDNTYSGGTAVSSGTLQLGTGGVLGSVLGPIAVESTLVYFHSDAATPVDNALSGGGTVRFRGTGGTNQSGYVLSGNDAAFAGSVVVESGARLSLTDPARIGAVDITVQNLGGLLLSGGGAYGNALSLGGLGWFETAGQLGALQFAGNTAASGAVTLTADARITTAAASDTGTLSGAINDGAAGYGLEKTGAGLLVLSGASTYTGATAVSEGTLQVNGSLATAVLTVADGATLGGLGSVAGSVTVNSGGHLSPGTSPGTITTGALFLEPGAILDYELNGNGSLGGPVNDLTNVNGDLTLNGLLNVSSTRVGGLGLGLYRLINYTGSFTNPGATLVLNTLPPANDPANLFVQTAIAHQVNLVSTNGLSLNIWDGGDTTLHDNGAIEGGDGTWDNTNQNWTTLTGVRNGHWDDNGIAIFAAAPGTVIVSHSAGAVNFSGMQFATGGYVITGQALTTITADTAIRVGDGTGPGAAFTATIAAEITGTGGIKKEDFGTLVLTGTNTYTGPTLIEGGALQIGDGGLTGSVPGDITDNAVLAFNRSDTATYAGIVSGTGMLSQAGAGTLVLTGASTYTGGTLISGGTLQLGAGGPTGSIVGDILDDAALVFNHGVDVTFANTIAGTGTMTKLGANTLIFTGNGLHTGGTTLTAGTLQIGDGGTAGFIAGNIVDNAALVFKRSDVVFYGGVAGGTGTLTQAGGGTLVLTGTNTYAGGTHFNAGTIYAFADVNFGAATGLLSFDTGTLQLGASFEVAPTRAVTLQAGGGTVDTNTFNTALSGVIAGPGQLTKVGAGTLTLAAANTYAGGTRLNGGVVQASADNNLGAATSPLSFDTGTLRLGAAFDVDPARALTLQTGGGAIDTNTFNATVAGVITGPGLLTKLGAGTLTLAAANSYAGGTFIAGGTVAAAANGNLGAADTPVIFSGGTLQHLAAFNTARPLLLEAPGGNIDTHGFDVIYSGAVVGPGILNKTGAGKLIFTNVLNLSAGTMISEGTMQIGDGNTTGTIATPIVNNSILVFDRSDDLLTYAGTSSGPGLFFKRGPGILTIAGVNTGTGLATIEAGTLRVNGSMTNPILISAHATLAGSGRVGPTVNGGWIAPGQFHRHDHHRRQLHQPRRGHRHRRGQPFRRRRPHPRQRLRPPARRHDRSPARAGPVCGAAALPARGHDRRRHRHLHRHPAGFRVLRRPPRVHPHPGVRRGRSAQDRQPPPSPEPSFNTNSVAAALDDIRPGATGELLDLFRTISVMPTDEAIRTLNSLTGEIHPARRGFNAGRPRPARAIDHPPAGHRHRRGRPRHLAADLRRARDFAGRRQRPGLPLRTARPGGRRGPRLGLRPGSSAPASTTANSRRTSAATTRMPTATPTMRRSMPPTPGSTGTATPCSPTPGSTPPPTGKSRPGSRSTALPRPSTTAGASPPTWKPAGGSTPPPRGSSPRSAPSSTPRCARTASPRSAPATSGCAAPTLPTRACVPAWACASAPRCRPTARASPRKCAQTGSTSSSRSTPTTNRSSSAPPTAPSKSAAAPSTPTASAPASASTSKPTPTSPSNSTTTCAPTPTSRSTTSPPASTMPGNPPLLHATWRAGPTLRSCWSSACCSRAKRRRGRAKPRWIPCPPGGHRWTTVRSMSMTWWPTSTSTTRAFRSGGRTIPMNAFPTNGWRNT
ncbi:MAG: autotransporter-associated beta strand repeat-containing protein [Lacunisphaera sp.]